LERKGELKIIIHDDFKLGSLLRKLHLKHCNSRIHAAYRMPYTVWKQPPSLFPAKKVTVTVPIMGTNKSVTALPTEKYSKKEKFFLIHTSTMHARA